jgi:hypothetical protein
MRAQAAAVPAAKSAAAEGEEAARLTDPAGDPVMDSLLGRSM